MDLNVCAMCRAPSIGADLFVATCGHLVHLRCARNRAPDGAETLVMRCPRCTRIGVVRIGEAASSLDERLVAAIARGDGENAARLRLDGARDAAAHTASPRVIIGRVP